MKRTFVVCMLLVLAICIHGIPAAAADEEQAPAASGFETNMQWTPKSAIDTNFTIDETGMHVGESYQTVYAISDQYVDVKTSFTVEYEFDIISTSPDELVIQEGWIQEGFYFGLPAAEEFDPAVQPDGSHSAFTLFPVTSTVPSYRFAGGLIEMEREVAEAAHLSVKIEYLASFKELNYYVNGEYIGTEYFIPEYHEGYLGISSAWVNWNITKAIFTAYPEGLAAEQEPETPEATENAVTAAPETSTPERQTERPGQENGEEENMTPWLIGGIAAAVIIIAVVVTVIVSKKKK